MGIIMLDKVLSEPVYKRLGELLDKMQQDGVYGEVSLVVKGGRVMFLKVTESLYPDKEK
jgi:hypothetical protein